jgi:hypothetical protein
MMVNGQIFRYVDQHSKRLAILDRLSQLTGIFTTIHTLQQDCKYIRPCGRILRVLVLGDSTVRNEMMHEHTVEELMATTFVHSAGSFASYGTFQNNLKLLYLHVMRDLKLLSGEHCLLEVNERPHPPLPRDHKCWFELARRANALGFVSKNIKELLVCNPHLITAREFLVAQNLEFSSSELESHTGQIADMLNQAQPRQTNPDPFALTSTVGEQLQRRCGRQYTLAYKSARYHYTPRILNLREIPKGHDITSLYVWKSRFHAFWGYIVIEKQPTVEPSNVMSSHVTPHQDDQGSAMEQREYDASDRRFLNVVLNYEDQQRLNTASTPVVVTNDTTQLAGHSVLESPEVAMSGTKHLFDSSGDPQVDVDMRDAAQRGSLNRLFKAQKSTKQKPLQLSKAAISQVMQYANNKDDRSQSDVATEAVTVASNATETQLAPLPHADRAVQPVASTAGEMSPEDIRMYYLEANTTWVLVGRYNKERIVEEVTKFLAVHENTYLFDCEGRDILPEDCGNLGEPFVCVTSIKEGFGDGRNPPDEVPL